MTHPKHTRRSFLAIGAGTLAASLLAACGAPAAAPTQAPESKPAESKPAESKPAESKPTESKPAATKPAEPAPKVMTPTPEPTPALAQVQVKPGQTKVDWWTPRGGKVDLDAMQKVQEMFHKSQDKIVVQPVYVPTTAGTQMSEKLLTSIAAGTPPDSAEFDRFIVASWAAKGSLEDLTDLAKSSNVTADQYYPFSWEEASYKGKLYALPFDTDTRGIYINTDLVKAAGLDIAQAPKTIAELDQWAEKLTKKEGRKFVHWGYSPAFRQSFHFAVGLQFGETFYDMQAYKCTANSEKGVEAFTWMKSYADKYNIEDMEAFQSAFGTQANDPFLTGQIAMIADGDWALANIKRFKPDLNFTVIPMPGKDGPAPCMAGGWSHVLPKGTKKKAEAFTWISFYAGKEGQRVWNLATMHIPTNIEASNDPGFREDPKHGLFMDFLKTAKNRPPIPAGQLLWNSLGEAQSAVLHAKKTPKQALDDVAKAVDEEQAKYK